MGEEYNEEVIADSEDDEFYSSPTVASALKPVLISGSLSSIQSSSKFQLQKGSAGPSISSFSTDPNSLSMLQDPEAKAPRSRPRPRPLYKIAPADRESIVDASYASSSNKPSSIAAASFLGQDVASLETMNVYSLDISERAKLRSRRPAAPSAPSPTKASSDGTAPGKTKAQKDKTTISRSLSSEDVVIIDSDSDTDELAIGSMKSLKTTRPSRAKQKPPTRSKDAHSRNGISSEQPISLPPSSFPIPISSQLPPANPPTSTLNTENEPDVPPIAVLPALSSSPLFSPPVRKRKRVIRQDVQWDDDLFDGALSDVDAQRMPPPSLPPPPTFFASSSSAAAESSSNNEADRSVETESETSIVLGSEPPIKKNKKDSGGSVHVKPSQKIEKPKPKPKRKDKKTKQKKSAEMEVVIEAPKSFKSTEFVDSEDDDSLAVHATPSEVPGIIPDSSTSEADKTSSPNHESDAMILSPTSGRESHPKRKNKKRKAGTDVEPRGTVESKKPKKSREPPVSKASSSGKAVKRRRIVQSDDEGENSETLDQAAVKQTTGAGGAAEESVHAPDKLHAQPEVKASQKENQHPKAADEHDTPSHSKLTRRTSIATPRGAGKSTSMSELIRRVNSLPGSLFSVSTNPSTSGTSYSPYLKASRSILSRIAPLHPNRRPPPPPLPKPPPVKKTKKQLEMEDRWEEELSESVEGWAALSDEERAALRRAKRDQELGLDD